MLVPNFPFNFFDTAFRSFFPHNCQVTSKNKNPSDLFFCLRNCQAMQMNKKCNPTVSKLNIFWQVVGRSWSNCSVQTVQQVEGIYAKQVTGRVSSENRYQSWAFWGCLVKSFCFAWTKKSSAPSDAVNLVSEIPVFPTVTAKITFQQFNWEEDIPASNFFIPRDYHEDPYRFPDLWHFLELTFIHILTSQRCLGYDESSRPLVGLDVPLTNLGNSSAEMTLIF